MTPPANEALRESIAHVTPEAMKAAWDTWHARHGGKLGPGPAFAEALAAGMAVVLADLAAAISVGEMAATSGAFYARQAENAERRAEAAESTARQEKARADGLETDNHALRSVIDAAKAEAAFMMADEVDGSATPQTRNARFGMLRDALNGVGDPAARAALQQIGDDNAAD